MDDYNHKILIKIEEDEDVKEKCTEVKKTERSLIENSYNSSPTNHTDYQKTIDGQAGEIKIEEGETENYYYKSIFEIEPQHKIDENEYKLNETGGIKIGVGETEDYYYKSIFEIEQQKTIDEYKQAGEIKIEVGETEDYYYKSIFEIEQQKTIDEHKITETNVKDEDYEDVKQTFSETEKSYISCMPAQNNFLKNFDGNIYKVSGTSHEGNKKINSCPVESRAEIEYNEQLAPKDNIEVIKERRLFYCDICQTSYHTKKQIRLHIMKSHKRSINKCSTQKPKIIHGMKYTSGFVNPHYKCDVCFKDFSYKSLLARHKRVHTKDKPYECAECSKSFSLKSHLEKHEIVHAGERPYKCAVCLKSFSRKDILTKHERVHTGEKPYQCAVCSKSFTQKSNLTTHKRVHTKEKPYQCAVCSKWYVSKSTLAIHRRVHTYLNPL